MKRYTVLFLAGFCAFLGTKSLFSADWIVSDPPVVQTEVNGQTVDRYGPTWVLRSAPDLIPDRPFQTGNNAPKIKIQPKTSDEITANNVGVNATRMPRSRRLDVQPLEAVNLIDGDGQTCWMSRGQRHCDEAPVWLRLDFPAVRTVEKTVLRIRTPLRKRNPYSYPVVPTGNEVGRGLPLSIKLEAACDGHNWTTLYEGPIAPDKDLVEISFTPTAAKQIRLTAGKLNLCETMYACSFAEWEMITPEGENAALVSTGTGITASSTDHGPGNEIEMHRQLWPIQSGIGAKWVRIGYHDDPVNWHHVEKEKGVLAVDPVADAAITEMTDHGVNVVMCLDFGNRIYSGPERSLPQMWEWYWDLPTPPTTPEALAAWDRYVEFMVEKYKDRVHYFELWNEWDIPLYWGEAVSLENYLTIAERTAAIIRRHAPEAVILSGSVSGSGFPIGCRNWSETDWEAQSASNIYLKMFRTLAPLVDVIGWHPYYNPEPSYLNDYPEDVRVFKKWLASIGFKGRCMSTEWNVSMRDRPLEEADRGRFFGGLVEMSEMQKAKFVSQIYLQDAGLGLPSFFCEIYNPYHAADLSLLRRTIDNDPVSALQPQAAFYAVRNIAGYTDGFTPAETPIDAVLAGFDPSQIRAFLYKTPAGNAAAVWQKGNITEEEQTIDLTLAADAENVTAFDPINGVEQPLQTESVNGQTVIRQLHVSSSPLILCWKAK